MQKVIIIGSSGSGKTTLAKELSQRLDVPMVELDDLAWNPDWQLAGEDVFAERVNSAIAGQKGWAVAGCYGAIRKKVLLPQADTLIWLDLPFFVSLWSMIRRTAKMAWTKKPLCNGNIQTWKKAFFCRDSLLLWFISTFQRKRDEYAQQMEDPQWAHVNFIRIKSRKELEQWLLALPK